MNAYEKRLSKLLSGTMKLSKIASELDQGVQFKIVDRFLGKFECDEQDNCLECLFDALATEIKQVEEEEDD